MSRLILCAIAGLIIPLSVKAEVVIEVVTENGQPLKDARVTIQTYPERAQIDPTGPTDDMGKFIHKLAPNKDNKDYCVIIKPPAARRTELQKTTKIVMNMKDKQVIQIVVKKAEVPLPQKAP